MIYIGNGIYSNATPNEYIMHYGVIGMKWGVHRAREHEKNIYRHNRANGMSRQAAKQAYRDRMSGVKQFARDNRGTGLKSRDISNRSREEARNTIDNYDKKLKAQRRRKAIAVGLGAAAAGTAAYSGYRLAKGFKADKKADHLWKRSDLAEDLSLATLKAGNRKYAKNKNIVEYKKHLIDSSRYTKASLGLATKSNKARREAFDHGFESGRHGVYAALIGGAAGGVALANKIKTKRQMKKKKASVEHSDMTDPNHLEHYGVLGMKWGVHKAKNHLKLLARARRYSEGGYRTRQNSMEARTQYNKELEEVKNFAKSNKKTGAKVKDIEDIARNKARKEFGENYDKLYKARQISKGVSNGLLGLAGAGLAAGTIAQNKANRNYEKKNGLKKKISPFRTYIYNDKANRNLEIAGSVLGATAFGSLLADSARNGYDKELIREHWKKKYNK